MTCLSYLALSVPLLNVDVMSFINAKDIHNKTTDEIHACGGQIKNGCLTKVLFVKYLKDECSQKMD